MTRRAVLRRGVATGLAASSLGALGAAGTGAAQSEDGPAPPENIERGYWGTGANTFRWEWSKDVCGPGSIAHYQVQVREGEARPLPEDSEHSADELWPVVEEWTVPADTPYADVESYGFDSYSLEVRAVDGEGRRSEAVWAPLSGAIVDPSYTMTPEPERETLERGQSVEVPIEFSPVMGAGTDIVRVELEAWLTTPCTASLEAVHVDDPSLSLVSAEYAEDDSAVTIVAEGESGYQPFSDPIVTLTVVAEEPGGTVLYLDNTDLEMADEVSSNTAMTRLAAFTVEEGLPAPENVRLGEQVSSRATVTWDWPGDLCSDRLSHFDVTVENDRGTETHTVAPGTPTVEAEFFGQADTVVTVQAVGDDGTTSATASQSFPPSIADPAYLLNASGPDDLAVGETGTLSVGLDQLMGPSADLLEWELRVDVAASCVATLEDVSVADGWELQETEFSNDGRSVRFAASGEPPETDDLRDEPLGSVTVTAREQGETHLNVDDGGLRFLTDEISYDQYEYYSHVPEELPEDTDIEDFVLEIGATREWQTLSVAPDLPTVDGAVPQDLDDDGYYRDVDGDDSVGQSDVAEFFRRQHREAWKRPEYFDFSGNGDVTHGDVVELFDYVALEA